MLHGEGRTTPLDEWAVTVAEGLVLGTAAHDGDEVSVIHQTCTRRGDETCQLVCHVPLAIVRGLAAANGGDAWYEPAEPHGACFVASVPVAA